MEALDTLVLNKPRIDVVLQLITLVGILCAVWLYFEDKRHERRDREYGTYNALDDKYIDFLRLCLENPDLDVMWDIPLLRSEAPRPGELRREKILFSILTAILERAYLMYREQTSAVRRAQWAGWEAYIRLYMVKQNFRDYWESNGDQWDINFVTYMNSLFWETADSMHDTKLISR